MIRLTLPLPPSKNDLTRRVRMRGGGYREYPTSSRLLFEATVKKLGKVRRVRPIEDGPVLVELIVYRGLDRKERSLRRGDLANYEELLFDALQGVAYRNDSQIRRIESELREDRQRPRVEVQVSEFET